MATNNSIQIEATIAGKTVKLSESERIELVDALILKCIGCKEKRAEMFLGDNTGICFNCYCKGIESATKDEKAKDGE